jgi:2-polyprenyl-6-methoxyphenol hydroxylase-like FAD-dependent oxidoreductase
MESAMSNLPASTNSKGRVLVSGASFAGLSTAYWMDQLGYDVTLVEIGKTLKKGGTPVNIEGDTIDIVRRTNSSCYVAR